MGTRWYDPYLARWISPDTIVPDPSKPQALNRYSYGLNSPLRYSDPSGHDPLDSLYFLAGFAAQWAYNNAWISAQAQEALAAKPDEPWAMRLGRHGGNAASVLQGTAEVVGGAGLTGGGAVACGTAVLCVAGAPAVGAGLIGIGHGAGTGLSGASQEGQMLGEDLNQFLNGKAGDQPIPAIRAPSNRFGLHGNMERAGIEKAPGMRNPEAHHRLPWKFKDWFAAEGRGLNVNDPEFGRWVEGTPPGTHQSWSSQYEQGWLRWIRDHQNATRQDVLDFLKQLESGRRFPSQ